MLVEHAPGVCGGLRAPVSDAPDLGDGEDGGGGGGAGGGGDGPPRKKAKRERRRDGKFPCREFARNGSCRFGDRCRFSHLPDDDAAAAAPVCPPAAPPAPVPAAAEAQAEAAATEEEAAAPPAPQGPQLLRPGALLVLTVKLVFRGRQQLLRQVEQAARCLEGAFEAIEVHWLFANKRHERTIIARRKAW